MSRVESREDLLQHTVLMMVEQVVLMKLEMQGDQSQKGAS
jgi:hypothetical protein